jgi:hypothetical protein
MDGNDRVTLSGREHRPAQLHELTVANAGTECVFFVPVDPVAQFDGLLTIEADHSDMDGIGDCESGRAVGRRVGSVVGEGVAHKRSDPLVVRQDRGNHGHGVGIGTRPATAQHERHHDAARDRQVPSPRPAPPREFTELRIHDPPGTTNHAATI